MAQSPKGNVVPLGDHVRAKARLSKKESSEMLVGCRELALDRMARALSGMLDRVEDDLFELAEKALERESQNAYLDAIEHSGESACHSFDRERPAIGEHVSRFLLRHS